MPNHRHTTEFGGLPVVEFPAWHTLLNGHAEAMRRPRTQRAHDPGREGSQNALLRAIADPGSVAWRLRTEEAPGSLYGEPSWSSSDCEDLAGYVTRFAAFVRPDEVRALVVGNVTDAHNEFQSDNARDRLLEHASRWPKLRSLFFGEVLQEESQISWIEQTDVAPLLTAFPELTEFTMRGVDGLGLAVGRHANLRRLTVQSGGLPGEVARDIAASDLPALEHLELWLGDEQYGNDTTPADLAPVLSGEAFPNLRSLGLRNADNPDDWVRAVTEAPVVSRLHTLDLSLGTLTDEDAELLLAAPDLRGLQRLDLHHHFLSEDIAERVRAEFTAAGVAVDVSDPQEPDEDEGVDGAVVYLYPAVGE